MYLSWVRKNKINLLWIALIIGLSALVTLVPELGFAQFGGSGFESKVENINSTLITRLLPLLSVFGLVYASILAINGDADAKGKIVMVLIVSVIGFLAPSIIEWLKGMAM